MMKRIPALACFATFSMAASALSAADYAVVRSININSSPEEAWHAIGDFCDIDDWHPSVITCQLKVIDGSLHRVLNLDGGGKIVEKRIAVEPGLSYTYSIVSSPLAVEKYTATLSITRGQQSTITWSGRFASDDPAMEETIAGIYEAGLTAITDRLSE